MSKETRFLTSDARKTLKNVMKFIKTGGLIAKNPVSWLLSKLEL